MKNKQKINSLAKKNYYIGWIAAAVKYQLTRKDSDAFRRIRENMDLFVSPEKKADKKYMRRIERDVFISKLIYQVKYAEYFLFHFDDLNRDGRKKFVGDIERNELCAQTESGRTGHFFQNKYETYLRFQQFYGRKAVQVLSEEDYGEFEAFFDSNPQFMVKARDQSCGHGIYRVNKQTGNWDKRTLFEQILKDGGAVLEECIVQSSEMGKFHPHSVNTIRFATFTQDGNVTKMFAFMRMGRGNSEVDNCGAGGIFASVNMKTGILFTPGITQSGQEYLLHPESGEKIIGFQIPRWDELNEIAEKLALLIPEHKYCSWDFALTDAGWVLVEANSRGQFVFQYAEKKGCRDLIENAFHIKNGKVLR